MGGGGGRGGGGGERRWGEGRMSSRAIDYKGVTESAVPQMQSPHSVTRIGIRKLSFRGT